MYLVLHLSWVTSTYNVETLCGCNSFNLFLNVKSFYVVLIHVQGRTKTHLFFVLKQKILGPFNN